MKFISYYTPNYKEVMENNLLPTLVRFGLDYYVKEVPDQGSWHDNTDFKPKFIYDCLCRFQQDLVFSDADSEIIQYPELFERIPDHYDIAVHYLDWGKFWRGTPNSHPMELLSGTMMIRYNQKTLDLLLQYIDACHMDNFTIEQKVLQKLLDKSDLNIYDLPIEYCTIIKHNGTIPSYIKNPVIIHNQASREYRGKK